MRESLFRGENLETWLGSQRLARLLPASFGGGLVVRPSLADGGADVEKMQEGERRGEIRAGQGMREERSLCQSFFRKLLCSHACTTPTCASAFAACYGRC
jgi:hypothetical protein